MLKLKLCRQNVVLKKQLQMNSKAIIEFETKIKTKGLEIGFSKT